MDFDVYQQKSRTTAVYPTYYIKTEAGEFVPVPYTYPSLGMGGESGEVLEKVKKIARDNDGQLDESRKEMLIYELGDVLWYMASICTELGIPMSEVAEKNIKKLQARLNTGTLHGEGDVR